MNRTIALCLIAVAVIAGAAGCKLPKMKKKDAGAPYVYTPPTVATTATTAVPSVDPSAVEEAAKKAYLKHKSSCDMGNAFDCVNVGFDYQKGLGVPKDESTAADYYKKACDSHSRDGAEGCADLAWLYEMGYGVPKDEVIRSFQYAQTCAVLLILIVTVSLIDLASARWRRRCI